MESWNNIVNTALLGTDKKQISEAELPGELVEAFEQVNANTALDKEEKFLQASSIALNYRQCGVSALLKDNVTIKEAAKEDSAYCDTIALQVLKDILQEQSNSLLRWWLSHCNSKRQIVDPEVIPDLFEIAITQKQLRPLIVACCGKRGEWLSSFNADWNFYVQETNEDIWQNGTTEQRKKVLQKLRETHPARAREWLQQTWPAENANNKAELLRQLETNISEEDATWLEGLLEEKGQKVKEIALALLKQIPTSSLVRNYWNILKQSIALKKEKTLLGMLSKTSLQIDLKGVDDTIFKTGIERLSNLKEFTDDEFIIYQLIQFIPPQFWETHFNCSSEQIIGYFQKDKLSKKFLTAFIKSVIRYRDSQWAMAFMQKSEEFHIDLIPILREQEQDNYCLSFFEKESDNIIRVAAQREKEWSVDLAKAIFKHAAKHIYQYNKQFYNECIHLIPSEMVNELEKFAPAEEHLQNAWSNMSGYIIKLITLKLQTTQAFQS